MNRRDVLGAAAAGAAGLAGWPLAAAAQSRYPDHPIRLVIPFAPGGQTDILGRRFAQKLEAELGQPVVPDNKSGAGGTIGSSDVARSRPDGYTLLVGTSSTHSISPLAMDKQPYDPVKDFTAVAVLGVIPMCIVVNPNVPAKNLKELIDLIRKNPGKYSFGSAGMGSINHLTGELFKMRAGGLDYVHIPYKGSGQSVQDLLGGQVPTLMATLSSVQNYHRSGRVRILAVTTEQRVSAAPDIPTAIEAGLPGMVSYTYNMVFGPAGLPQPVLDTLATAYRKIMGDKAFQKELQDIGIEPVADSSGDKATAFLREESTRFEPVIKATGIRID
ncbi:tripartite tricarboxylate transporter substrate binding protein [Pigmentiphaga soli]|uniref:Tripartite tricarboxylate transporter substrate binding protein n=1 Tax=Pigmentiphaga soli TaxID=1007095 RepID=A0ABP8GER3_9BURK